MESCFNFGWKGQKDKTIGVASCMFQADWLDSDTSDEQDAATLIIHELSHWVEAYCSVLFVDNVVYQGLR